nr:UDP-N-acetylglucosamine--N-acetylmuramyl-(pentapeptide) pyrophosphoryl-undecaprenol N-acetylglucosamine transferase [Methylococcales bacterium]
MDKHILVLAGGTGGHVYPALAVAKHLSASGHQVSWMGTRNGLEGRVVPQNGIPIDWVSVSGIRGKRGFDRVKAPLLLLWACCQAGLILYRRKPHVVIGMGGFVSGPGGLMAWLMRIPLVIHEQNAIPGTTNRLLAWLAKRVLEAFPGSFTGSVHAVCTGNPVRLDITELRSTSIGNFQRPLRILVLGGSQGARTLNAIVPRVVGDLPAKIDVFHQSGTAMLEQTSKTYQSLAIDAKVEPFVEDMRVVYL